MPPYPAYLKHDVLREYVPGDHRHTFEKLARRHNIKGGKALAQKWYNQWNGTVASLERRPGSGRRALSAPQLVERLILKPIRRANRSDVAIEYPELKEAVEEKIGHPISIRTIQRQGHDAEDVKGKTTIPRTEQERML